MAKRGFWKELFAFGAVAYLGNQMEKLSEENESLKEENRLLQQKLEEEEEDEWNPYEE